MSKTTFAIEWGCFQYTAMPFGLKNAPTIFSRIVIVAFKEFIQKFLEVYFDDSIVFGLVKRHVANLRLMLDTCWRDHIVLNLKKCLFCVPFGILLGHVVCKQRLIVDPAKIAVINNLEATRSVKQLRATLGHTGYYWKFTKAYAQITVPMEKLLKKDATFCWDEECQCSLNVLKGKMVTVPILVFPDWKKEFHVHVDASCIALGVVLKPDTRWRRRDGSPYSICKQKIIKGWEELLNDRARGIGYGARTPKVQALSVGQTFQDVHRPFHFEVPSQ